MEVIEHLYQPRAFVLFIRSILEASGGGQFIVTTPYHGYLKNLTIALANKMDYHLSALWEGGHIKFWSRRTLAILLRRRDTIIWSLRAPDAYPTSGAIWFSAPGSEPGRRARHPGNSLVRRYHLPSGNFFLPVGDFFLFLLK